MNFTVSYNGSNFNISSSSSSSISLLPSIITICTIGIIGNVMVILVIVNSKKLHSPCFQLIACGALGSLLLAIGFGGSNFSKLGYRRDWWSLSNRYRLTCHVTNFYLVLMLSTSYTALTHTFVAADRLFGIFAPISYTQYSQKYTKLGISICAIFGLIEGLTVLLAGGAPFEQVDSCETLANVVGEQVRSALAIVHLSCCAMCVTVYLVMLISVEIRKRKMAKLANGGFPTMAQMQMYQQQHLILLPAVKMLLICYLLTGVVPEIIYTMAPGRVYFDLAAHLKALSTLVEICSLTLRCREFRNGVRMLIGLKSSQVTVLGGNPMGKIDKGPSVRYGKGNEDAIEINPVGEYLKTGC